MLVPDNHKERPRSNKFLHNGMPNKPPEQSGDKYLKNGNPNKPITHHKGFLQNGVPTQPPVTEKKRAGAS